jgi:tight adherence protein B
VIARLGRSRERAAADRQLPLVAEVLAAHVRAGRPIGPALAEAALDLPHPAAAALERAAAGVGLGMTVADALGELGDGADAAHLRAAIAMHERGGGDLALLLDRIAASLRARAAARHEAAVATAQARATGRIVSGLPVAAWRGCGWPTRPRSRSSPRARSDGRPSWPVSRWRSPGTS